MKQINLSSLSEETIAAIKRELLASESPLQELLLLLQEGRETFIQAGKNYFKRSKGQAKEFLKAAEIQAPKMKSVKLFEQLLESSPRISYIFREVYLDRFNGGPSMRKETAYDKVLHKNAFREEVSTTMIDRAAPKKIYEVEHEVDSTTEALTDTSVAINKIMSELDEYIQKKLSDSITNYTRVGVREKAQEAREKVSSARRRKHNQIIKHMKQINLSSLSKALQDQIKIEAKALTTKKKVVAEGQQKPISELLPVVKEAFDTNHESCLEYVDEYPVIFKRVRTEEVPVYKAIKELQKQLAPLGVKFTSDLSFIDSAIEGSDESFTYIRQTNGGDLDIVLVPEASKKKEVTEILKDWIETSDVSDDEGDLLEEDGSLSFRVLIRNCLFRYKKGQSE